MSSLAEKYHYKERRIHVPEQIYLDQVAEMCKAGEGRIVFPSDLIIDGKSIIYDVITHKTPRFLWIMLTAIDYKTSFPVGFRDVHINDGLMSWGDGCFGKRYEQLPVNRRKSIPDCLNGVPYQRIRFNHDSHWGEHSFLVKEELHGKGLGKSMLFTVFEFEKRIGVISHSINVWHDGTVKEDQNGNRKSYYQHLGARDHFGMYHVFDLNEETPDHE